MLSQYRKAVVSLIGAIVTILAMSGISLDAELVAAVTTVVTSLMVFLVPNQSPGLLEDQ